MIRSRNRARGWVGGAVAPPFDPEAGLTLTSTIAISTASNDMPSPFNGARSGTVIGGTVWAVDFTGLNPAAGGLVVEVGAAGAGTYIGFDGAGSLVARTGDGDVHWNAGTHYALFPSAGISGTGTLVVDIPVDGSTIRAWWNGVAQTPSSSVNVVIGGSNVWGADGGTYMFTSTNLVSSEIATPVATTTASGLRYYQGQTV